MSALQSKTSRYWRVSSIYNGVMPDVELKTGDALQEIGRIEAVLDPNRPLAKALHILKYDIIEGNSKWREPSKPQRVAGGRSNLIQLTRK